MKGKITLTPPNDGEIKVKPGDSILWFGKTPYRLDIELGASLNETESPER